MLGTILFSFGQLDLLGSPHFCSGNGFGSLADH
jgi:hypothetical protein